MQAHDVNGNVRDDSKPQPVVVQDGTLITAAAVTTAGSASSPIFPMADASGTTAVVVDVLIAPPTGNAMICAWNQSGSASGVWTPALGYKADDASRIATTYRVITGQGSYVYPRQGRFFTCWLDQASGGNVTISAYFLSVPVVLPAAAQPVVSPSRPIEGTSAAYGQSLLAIGGRSGGDFEPCDDSGSSWCMLRFTKQGQLEVFPYGNPKNAWNYATGPMMGTTGITVRSGASALNMLVTQCTVSAVGLSGPTTVVLHDGAGGVGMWRVGLAAGNTAPATHTFPIPLRAGVGNSVEVALETAVTAGGVYVSCGGGFGIQ